MSVTPTDTSTTIDPYAASFDSSYLQTFPEFSPVSVFSTEDFGADFTSDSATSPSSPLSPALSASSFGFPSTDSWPAWDGAELSPEPENLFGCQTVSSCPEPSSASLSPAINPLNLSLSAVDASTPIPEMPPIMQGSIPDQQQQQQQHRQQQQQQEQQQQQLPSSLPSIPETDRLATKRYPSRESRRKPSTGALSDSKVPTTRSTAAAATATTTATTARRASTTASTAKTKHGSSNTTGTTPALGPKKSAHNMIEKRYRTNLNDKIARLRDAVPSLRQLAQRAAAASEEGGPASDEDGMGTTTTTQNGGGGGPGAAKLNKATILARATEYILQLERRNRGLEAENGALRGRMEGLEVLLMGRAAAAAGRGRVVTGWE
ncbi:basic helix-loop-helix protein [Thermothelomyces heterothallicus CBS 203.75]